MQHPDALSAWLSATYPLSPPVECRLLRAYTNDVYLVRSAGALFVLKVYGRTWRTESDVRYEIALVQHLIARGMRIPAPLADSRGDFVQQIATVEKGGVRQAVLFAFAPGEKPQPPFIPSLYVAFGEAIGRLHALSSDFTSPYPRQPLDLTHLLDEPVTLALPLLENADDRAFLTDLARRLKARISAFAGLDWGSIHGDATLDNLHVTADGEVVLFDLDSGGPGWRAADLQGWTATSEEFREKGEAFRHGYSRVRPLNPVDVDAAPLLTLAEDIRGLKIDLANRVLAQGQERIRAYLRDRMLQIRERAGQVGL